MNTFIDAYKDMWRRYAQFSGRTSVGGYWRSVAVNFGILLVTFLLIVVLPDALAVVFGIALAIYYFAMIVPSLAIMVRRLHDTDKSGWMYFVSFIPLVGPILVLVWFVSGGTPGNNQYGPQPVGEQWSTEGFLPGGAYVAQMPGGTPPPPPPPAR